MARRGRHSTNQICLRGIAALYVFAIIYIMHRQLIDIEKAIHVDSNVNMVHINRSFKSGMLWFKSAESLMNFRRKRFENAQRRPPRDGPGEDGKPVYLTSEEQAEAARLFKRESFNVVASDKIAMDRSIPDTRHPE